MLERWGRFVHRHRWATLVASVVMLLASVGGLTQGGDLVGGGIIETSESGRALRLLQRELPLASGSSFSVVFSSETLEATDPRFRAAVEQALAQVKGDPRVRAVRTPYDTTPPLPGYVSNDGRKAVAIVAVRDTLAQASKYYPALREMVRSDTLGVSATGTLAITRDFNHVLEADLIRAEIVSLPLALILLLIVFGTVVAALLPLGVGILAVVGGVAGTLMLARVMDVSQYAMNIVTLIGLGVAIDYSLFIVARFREQLRSGASREDALALTLATAGRAVAFSGLTVAIGLSGMLFFEGTFLASMGLAGSIVVALAVLYGLTFLPALLAILGPRIDAWRLPLPRRGDGSSGMWHAVAMAVMQRPLMVLLPLLALFAFTAAPFLGLRMANGDVTMLPKHAESRAAYDTLVNEFPGQANNRISVVVSYPDGGALRGDRVPELVGLGQRLERLPEVQRVDSVFTLEPRLTGGRPLTAAEYQAMYAAPREALPPPLRAALDQSASDRVVSFTVLSASQKATPEAQALVREIRAQVPPAGAEVLVTGETAMDIDVVRFILDRVPAAIAWVMLATYVVLFLLLGSVILPLKAVVMNILSISTSFGALVWIFQQGNLAGLLGNFTPGPLDPTLPVILFCVVFGLSMDYEVLLLSRIQEEHLRTGDNRRAVAEGLERSGRLITGAAAIMVGVFGAFALADIVIIKALGFGMALAVAIDATLVRGLVVPATMRLLGELNWWAPAPLARLYRRLGLGETAAMTRAARREAAPAP